MPGREFQLSSEPAFPNTRQTWTTGIRQLTDAMDRFPYWALAIALRLAIATVFWNSAMTKLDDWDAAKALFTDEYHVPLIAPVIAAYLAVTIELSTPVLLTFGFLTRLAAFVLLGMTAFIEIFVYPQAWPTHIQWSAMLLVLLFRGPGIVSMDHLLWRRYRLAGRERTNSMQAPTQADSSASVSNAGGSTKT